MESPVINKYTKQYAESLLSVESALQYQFKQKELLMKSLTHRSFLHEHADYPLSHNERLEFLGDAVLELIVTEYLFEHYPKVAEGILTSIRAKSVRTETLAKLVRDLKINEHILISTGEAATGGRAKVAILADVFEAILGAIYLDGGYAPCKKLLNTVLFPKIADFVDQKLYLDPKTEFQEKVQATWRVTPEYSVVKETGPDHDKQFVCAVLVEGKEYARGSGSSKKRAEEDAARNALNNFSAEEK